MTNDMQPVHPDYARPETLGQNTDGMGRDQTMAVTTEETKTLISANKVQGTAVFNVAQDRLGTIDSIMLGKYSGKVAYAVMSFGGFLGIGERYHPLPWSVLTYDTDQDGYCINLSPEALKAAPNYTRGEVDALDYAAQGAVIDNYYADPADYVKGGASIESYYSDPKKARGLM